MTLSAADLQRARELAAAAPTPSAEVLQQLRQILSGSVAASAPIPQPQATQGGTADAA